MSQALPVPLVMVPAHRLANIIEHCAKRYGEPSDSAAGEHSRARIRRFVLRQFPEMALGALNRAIDTYEYGRDGWAPRSAS